MVMKTNSGKRNQTYAEVDKVMTPPIDKSKAISRALRAMSSWTRSWIKIAAPVLSENLEQVEVMS